MPKYEALNWSGMDFTRDQFNDLMEVDTVAWKRELTGHEELFDSLYDELPKEFGFMRSLMLSAIWRSPEKWGFARESYNS
jgi:phosphoenolpyruvate carboxykinase (GTP)